MRRLFEVLFIVVFFCMGCTKDKFTYPYKNLDYETIVSQRQKAYEVKVKQMFYTIDSLRMCEHDTAYCDQLVNKYYADRQPCLWVSRFGLSSQSESLVTYLDSATLDGFPAERFYLPAIKKNMGRFNSRSFDASHAIGKTLGMLEYYLTKSYIRYASGQRFGYINPQKVLNHIEHVDKDSLGSPYKTLYERPTEIFSDSFFMVALQNVREGKVEEFLQSVQPVSPLYQGLRRIALSDTVSPQLRQKLFVNMERNRWRIKGQPFEEKRKVYVNIPTQRLVATDGKREPLSMKICFGSTKHKTPTVYSHISHIEYNPYWNVPVSIVKKEIAPHAGDSDYFCNRHYQLIDRATGEQMNPMDVSYEMLKKGKLMVRQDKGAGNSLGRIIFRFPNSSAIYLHDTNIPRAFNYAWRTVSHGCVRLEKPFALASYLLKDKDEEYLDKLRLTLEMPPVTDYGKKLRAEGSIPHINRSDLTPPVPLCIVYLTCTLDESGKLVEYPDIYHYDPVIWRFLNRPAR